MGYLKPFLSVISRNSWTSTPLVLILTRYPPPIHICLFSCLLSAVDFLGNDVIGQLKSDKCDSLKLSSSEVTLPLSLYFSSVVRHGYMPKCLWDSVLVPVPKSSKYSSVSSNYRLVAKGLKHLILESYGDHLHNSHLQFVRQGSVLSPLLYIYELLSVLSSCGVGCYWGDLFAGCVCYADDC